jgi:hypothetical protein
MGEDGDTEDDQEQNIGEGGYKEMPVRFEAGS